MRASKSQGGLSHILDYLGSNSKEHLSTEGFFLEVQSEEVFLIFALILDRLEISQNSALESVERDKMLQFISVNLLELITDFT